MKKFILLLFFMIIGFSSCNNDDDGTYVNFESLQIVDAVVPDTFELGGRYEIVVTYLRPDDCTYFQGFDVYPQDTTVREVVAVGASYTDRPCTQTVTEVDDSFLFEVIYDQPYTFRFYQGEDENGDPEYLEVNVPVE